MNNIKELMAHEEKFLQEVYLPVMHGFFKRGDLVAYQQYNGNACRQTSFLVHKYLSEKYPQMSFDVWEGRISDSTVEVQYDHAWVYGTYRKGKKVENLLIDLPYFTQRTWLWTKTHVFPNETKMEVLAKHRLNPSRMGEIVEFYTSMTGNELYEKIMEEINSMELV